MMALSGVRSSWLIRASMSDLALAARSVRRLACCNSFSLLRVCERSRNTAKKFGPSARVRPIVIDSGMKPPWRTRPSISRPCSSRLHDARRI